MGKLDQLKWGLCAEKPPGVGFKESGDMCKVMLKKISLAGVCRSPRRETLKIGNTTAQQGQAWPELRWNGGGAAKEVDLGGNLLSHPCQAGVSAFSPHSW